MRSGSCRSERSGRGVEIADRGRAGEPRLRFGRRGCELRRLLKRGDGRVVAPESEFDDAEIVEKCGVTRVVGGRLLQESLVVIPLSRVGERRGFPGERRLVM